MNEETKRKISEALKGRFVGEKHANYGRHLSEQTKRKISEAMRRSGRDNKSQRSSTKAWRNDAFYPRCARCDQKVFPGMQRRFVRLDLDVKIMVCTECVEDVKTPTVSRVALTPTVSSQGARARLVKHGDIVFAD